MYNAGYVVSIVAGGRVVEESRQDVVRLPFDTEYAIRLRNRTSRDAVAQIFIDGENVSKDGFIVRANNAVDIECHVATLRNFRFVSADSHAAAAAGKDRQPDDRNGVIEVRWRAEKERPLPVVKSPDWPIFKGRRIDPNSDKWFDKGVNPPSSYRYDGHTATLGCVSRDQNVCNFDADERPTEGCTVEGRVSDQRFRLGHIGELVPEAQAVVCRLFLKGPDRSSAGYCTECGRPPLPADRFCGSCGNQLYTR